MKGPPGAGSQGPMLGSQITKKEEKAGGVKGGENS